MLIQRKWHIYEKIEAVEKQVNIELPEIEIKQLAKMFSRISHYIRGNVKSITNEERLLYDFMLRHKLNNRSLYQWFLLKEAPYDIKKRVIEGKLWLRHALKEMADFRRLKENPNDNTIINDIRNYIKDVVK